MDKLKLTPENINNYFQFARDFGLISESQYYQAISTNISQFLEEIANLEE